MTAARLVAALALCWAAAAHAQEPAAVWAAEKPESAAMMR